MTKTTKKWIIIGLLGGIFFLLGTIISYNIPKIEAWILVSIEKESRNQGPARILPQSASLSLLPIGVELSDVRVIPSTEFQKTIDPFIVKKLNIGLSLWSLIRGQINPDSLEIEGINLNLRIADEFQKAKKSGEKSEKLNFEKILDAIPVRQIKLLDVSGALDLKTQKSNFLFEKLELTLRKQSRSLFFSLDAPEINVKTKELKEPLTISTETKIFVLENKITLSSAKISNESSYALASGILDVNYETQKLESLDLKTRLNIQSEEMTNLINQKVKEFELPPSTGVLKADLEFRKNASRAPITATAKIETNNFFIDGHEVGNANISASASPDKVSFDKIEVVGSGGKILLWDTVIEKTIPDLKSQLPIELPPRTTVGPVKPPEKQEKKSEQLEVKTKTPQVPEKPKVAKREEVWTMKTQVGIPSLEVARFLDSIRVNDVPIRLPLNGQFPCTGQVYPEFELKCEGSLNIQSLNVTNRGRTTKIVDFLDGELVGQLRVNLEEVEYDTKIRIGESKGHSKGIINYETGFNISYSTDQLRFEDIQNLAELDFEGDLKIKGVTQGTSEWATIDMNVSAKDFVIEDFYLSELSSRMTFKKGVIGLKSIKGTVGNSRYLGTLDIDVDNNRIKGNATMPFMTAPDLLRAFKRKTQLPFRVNGTGTAQVEVSGPLRFNELTYNLKSSLFRGKVGPEPFDEIAFDVVSENGNVRTKRVFVSRGRSKIYMSGKGYPDGNIDVRIFGQGLHIEDSNLISQSGLKIVGLLDLDMSLKNYVLSPDTNLYGKFHSVSLGGQPVEDSSVKLQLRSTSIEGIAQFLGGTLKTEFLLPFDLENPFRLKINANNWNFARLISSFDENLLKRNFDSNLTGNIDIYSAKGGIWAASGGARVDDFMVRRDTLRMMNPKPIVASMTEGRVEVNDLNIVGEDTFFRVKNTPRPKQPLDIQINSKLNLSLLSLFTPFLEDLRGTLSAAFELKAGPKHFEVLGSSFIDKGFFKFYNFPHGLSEVRADLLFSQQQIQVNSLKGSFASGRFFGDGKIEFKGFQDIPIDISVQVEEANLKFPQNYDTYGDATVKISGNWFPFTIGGEYLIQRGSITGTLTQGTGDGSKEAKNEFLPELFLETEFSPLQLDMKVKTLNPVDLQRIKPIVISEVQGRAMADIRIKGPLSDPKIFGPISVLSNSIIDFQENEFKISTATIEMRGQEEVNPNLYVEATTRKNGYEISLLVQGEALNPQVSLTSTPNLPEQDIVSLLALGITSRDLDESVSSTEQLTTSIFQGGAAYLLSNPVQKEIKERFGWDAQIAPTFDDENNTSVPKVLVSRKLSDKADITASRELGKQPKTDVKVKYQLNPKLSIIGSFESTGASETTTTTTTERDEDEVYGLDFEYRLEFK